MTADQQSPTVLLLTFARRGEEETIRRALAYLAHTYPAGRVFAVATPASADMLRTLWVPDLILYQGPRTARAVLRETAARRPQAAAIIYWDDRPQGHLKLELLALASGARQIHRCFPAAGPQVTGRGRLLGSVVAKLGLAALTALGALLTASLAFVVLRLAQSLARRRRTPADRWNASCG